MLCAVAGSLALSSLKGMLPSFPWRPLIALPAGALLIGLGARVVFGTEVRTRLGASDTKVVRAELVNVPTAATGGARMRIDFDSLAGRSGSLRSRLLEPAETRFYPGVSQRFGNAVRSPGVRLVDTGVGGKAGSFAFITLAPWRMKVGSHINGYHVGHWPGEYRVTSDRFENPEGFIEVTRDNLDTPLSTHFRLRDFITHDQQHVWPKYVVLREELLDKLELMLNALQSFGVPTHHVVVLSGFRSPQYNARGASEGMARSSRHQYGDAADIIIDANRDGRMDDLNQDGRVTFADLQVVDRAVQLIERQYPELVGGLGLYHQMGPSGPFAHIDVRGTRARWTNLRTQRRATGSVERPAAAGPVQPSARCAAEGAMAVLCAGVR